MNWEYWLPLVFFGLLGFVMTVYVILDGFDLGVGMLLPRASKEEQHTMVGSIGPFWDANETWLVLGAGVLFIAFPKANTVVLGNLYLPATFMLFALIIRGAAFDFRVKADDAYKELWNIAFVLGSAGMALTQGWMLGRYITGFATDLSAYVFALAIMFTVPAVYVALGATWLVAKTEGALQEKARTWAQQSWYPVVFCLLLISAATPWVSPHVAEKWFSMPNMLLLAPIPLVAAFCLWRVFRLLRQPEILQQRIWQPFAYIIATLILCAMGLGISLFPNAVIGQLTVWQAAESVPTLVVTLIGVSITVPCIIAYSIFAYWVFRGKASHLVYG
ncbi:cytochrome d ubiquinol oxidase subunit II [Kingella negevensis]|uniref:Cytochrome bd-II ubiquinol oxidase subunit 2 n=1 Tax=Kingella negevensis TaxID=1522312 RepID=A0A238TAU5_9NEIS|nr:cytochrome d ubiquinol oxidase subunit II [Kingella negevensis]MDK4681256.1 cytochrome d ubiquinol oxidase subunit II [Kingella negevensis]MDK4683453.1 cytochrome d ubiquinol oxidase subunit II [Kingella negevensis]MDK4684104.1 cytochrome d ubiquinol oxidase subunit II [Kingella negevensis]MDK4689153.1 cytochrome d ubiquinol oxidase subunit II [Kingella negevensis]MDK4691412.1 cytochrome d ubiquinol oxidase subunit II [Kingella negevensis]